MNKKEEKKMQLYYAGLLKLNLTQIEGYLDRININDLLLLKNFIEQRKFQSNNNNIIKDEFLITIIKNNIQSRMPSNGARRD